LQKGIGNTSIIRILSAFDLKIIIKCAQVLQDTLTVETVREWRINW